VIEEMGFGCQLVIDLDAPSSLIKKHKKYGTLGAGKISLSGIEIQKMDVRKYGMSKHLAPPICEFYMFFMESFCPLLWFTYEREC